MNRYLVVAGLFVLSLITYIDRAAIASAKDAMSGDLGLTNQSMGAVFSSFALGYALAQIPSGWLADRFGPRLLLTAVVVLWSALTGMTGLVTTLTVLLVVRFLFGVAEAGAFPGAARAFYNWLPSGEHGRANGIIFAGSRLGAAAAFPLMAWLLERWSWRTAFYLLAVPGLLWGIAWFLMFRDHPGQPLPRADKAAAPPLDLGKAIRAPFMLYTMLQYFAANFTTFLTLSWMLPYLKAEYNLSTSAAAYYATLPLLFGATAQWAAGTIVDKLYTSRFKSWSRASPAIFGFTLSTAGMIALCFADTPISAVASFVLASYGVEMTISPSWSYCLDMGGIHSGALTGAMNMMGNFSSFLSANAFPFLQNLTGSADSYFLMTAALNLVAVFCWTRMRRLALTSHAGPGPAVAQP
ncbi:MAG: MFS transporter [Acidobacteriia bacterium]|nr:MFS transporter [Terriglobia bacterium]